MTSSDVGRRTFQFTPRVARRILLVTLVAIPAVALTQSQAPQDWTPSQAPSQATQDFSNNIPAHVAIVDGRATLTRDGRLESSLENVPLLAGDRVQTERGRVEILFADGSALDIDELSTVDFQSDSLLRLLAGRVRLQFVPTRDALDYRVDTAAASVFIRTAGEYRLALSDSGPDPQLDLVVLRGSAELANSLGRTLVRAGTHALATAERAPSLPYFANSAAWDAFDRWSQDQQQARLGADSTRYLPADLQYYGGALDRYGSWAYEPDYGNVWYPRVDAGWRPYSDGRWAYVGAFGWTWVGFDAWSWPTHHYGRWGLRANRWCWIPDHRWGPAWVSWAFASDYVSWCPLGFDGRPVFGRDRFGRGVEPRFGWTVLSSREFRPNVEVGRHAVDHSRLSQDVWSQFATRTTGPAWHDTALLAPPIRRPGAVGGYAVPRRPDVASSVATGATAAFPARRFAEPPSRFGQPAARIAEPAARIAAPTRDALGWQSRQQPALRAEPRLPAQGATPGPRLQPSVGRTPADYQLPRPEPSRTPVMQRAPAWSIPATPPSRTFHDRGPSPSTMPTPSTRPSVMDYRRLSVPERFVPREPPRPIDVPRMERRAEPRGGPSGAPSIRSTPSAPPPHAAPQRSAPSSAPEGHRGGQAVRRGR